MNVLFYYPIEKYLTDIATKYNYWISDNNIPLPDSYWMSYIICISMLGAVGYGIYKVIRNSL